MKVETFLVLQNVLLLTSARSFARVWPQSKIIRKFKSLYSVLQVQISLPGLLSAQYRAQTQCGVVTQHACCSLALSTGVLVKRQWFSLMVLCKWQPEDSKKVQVIIDSSYFHFQDGW